MPSSRRKIGRIAAYAAAFTIPVAITYLVAALRLPPFVFEHLIVLLVVGVAITWGVGPSVVAALRQCVTA